jgi:DNA-binding NarL/FixJ family response regulator
VLVIDDHALLADGLCLELARAGFETSTIAGPTPEAIIARTRDWAPTVALLDLHLGASVGCGLDLVAALIEQGAIVVVLSGATDQALLAACVEAGAEGVVSKTDGLDSVRETVERAARGDRVLPLPRREELLAALWEQRRAERARHERFGHLTRRECDVLARLMRGQAAATIADESFVSLATIRTQIRSILQKLGVTSQLAAVAVAHEAGWSYELSDELAAVG